MFTLDVITPIVDDPGDFGAIAAANALSDVYAMGGNPEVALSFAGMPDKLGLDVLHAVLFGMAAKAKEAGCAIVGGHTIKDSEPKCGLAVIGSVEPGSAWTHRGARAGQALVLTKPIGTGVIAQALRAGKAPPGSVEAATRSMVTLNRRARDLGRAHGASAATDITGFGLLSHLYNMLAASGIAARVEVSKVPLLPGALEVAKSGHVPGGSARNCSFVSPHLSGAERIDPLLVTLLTDAQTSGGLLLAVDMARAKKLVGELADGSAVIGELVDGQPGNIELF